MKKFKENQSPLREDSISQAIAQLPKIGYFDFKLGVTVLPASEYDPEDDIWDEIYKRKYGDE